MPDQPMRPSYLRVAFWNVYNVTSLAGIAAASLLTHEGWLLGMGLAAEALWLLLVPDNKRFQRAVNARFSAEQRLEAIRRTQEEARLLPSDERARVQNLGARAAEVKAECLRNPRLKSTFMDAQLDRLDELVAEYIHLAVTTVRCEGLLNRTDLRQLNRERDNWRKNMEAAPDDATKDIARQNMAVLEKRLAVNEELARFTMRARGQMSLIQNTISLMRDQVVTMATPETLTGQLDELVTSVEALRDATRDAEAIVGGVAPISSVVADLPPGVAESGVSSPASRVRE